MAMTYARGGDGGGLDGGRWLWKPGTAVVFSSPLQRRCSFSWFPLFPLSTLFFPLYNSFMEVQEVAVWRADSGEGKVYGAADFLCWFPGSEEGEADGDGGFLCYFLRS
jgi:hypothetical protein